MTNNYFTHMGLSKEDSSKDSDAKIVLNRNGKTIKSLNDLRNNYTPELLLEAHMNQDLYNWLKQHYYEIEAQAVSCVSITDKDCLKKLCRILGTELPENKISPEEAAVLEEKKEILRGFTSDESIIENAGSAAMNQEELAELLNRGCTVIYLCGNSFSIPLSKPNIKYIGVGKVEIENAFTRKQYEKSGIEIENISLPAETSEYMEEIAHKAATDNGYDDFADTHSPLTTALHDQLKSRKIETEYHLPYSSSVSMKFFTSRYECEKAGKNAIEKAYKEAEKYFDTASTKSVSGKATGFYSHCISSVFTTEIINCLSALCKITGSDYIFTDLSEKISRAGKNLKGIFDAEINDNFEYYKMYDMNYFIDRTDIEGHDYRVSEGGFFKLLETIVADNYEYTVNGLFDSIREMETDLNEHAASFFFTAYMEYLNYISDLEKLIEEIGKGLPPFRENETVAGYLSRMCVEKSL